MQRTTKILIVVLSALVISLAALSIVKIYAFAEVQNHAEYYEKYKIHVKYLKVSDNINVRIVEGAAPNFTTPNVSSYIDKDTLKFKKSIDTIADQTVYNVDLPDLEGIYISGKASVQMLNSPMKKMTIYASDSSYIYAYSDSINATCKGKSMVLLTAKDINLILKDRSTAKIIYGIISGSIADNSRLVLNPEVSYYNLKIRGKARIVSSESQNK